MQFGTHKTSTLQSIFRLFLAITTMLASTTKSLQLHIHWFRNADLRLHDNPALTKAIADLSRTSAASNKDAVLLPIYCFDPRFIGSNAKSEFGSLKCSARRAQFMRESVEDLRQNLKKRGSNLLVAQGKAEDVIGSLLQGIQSKQENMSVTVYCQTEVTSEELSVDKKVRDVLFKMQNKNNKFELESVWGSTLYLPQDLPFPGSYNGIPDVFTPFRNKVEKNADIRIPFTTPKSDVLSKLVPGQNILDAIESDMQSCSLSFMPTLEDMGYSVEEAEEAQTADPRGVMHFKGGETAALARVKDYIWDKDLLKTYFDTRNGMIGADYSTKFSPWLANGCVSPRYIATECKRYEDERIANKSTYWVVFELLWRDFFKFFAAKHGTKIFMIDGTSPQHKKKWGYDPKQFAAWKEGRTGYPLVDANMRELAATGFMSNRGRQNVCSFLTIDMNTDWRRGADYFESELLDYDVPSNWGNWVSGAGMTGGRLNRFNIVKQSKDYDCDGDYVRQWIPELWDVPTELIHTPWKMNKEQQKQYGCVLGVDYPKPIIEPFVPKPYKGKDGAKGGKGKGKGQQQRGRKENPRLGKGQRKDMKSLKEGSYRVVGEWTA
mmetsp:Transcript_7658/g.11250  ORF Transcript_7658/g.11250 Transcript_7658/m.11250 type:complete len:605 (+) Transcript_7658:108-1922(+)